MLTTVYVLEIRQFTLVIALEGGTWLNQLFCLAKTCIEEDPATCSCCVELGTPHAFVRCLSTVAGGLLAAARVEKGMIGRGTRTGPQRSEMPWRTAAGHLDNGCLLPATRLVQNLQGPLFAEHNACRCMALLMVLSDNSSCSPSFLRKLAADPGCSVAYLSRSLELRCQLGTFCLPILLTLGIVLGKGSGDKRH